jgi:indolepyruvate ferredoxin oxidoreductase beta subunit
MNFLHDPFNIIISGVGGQGNILLSRMIGRILTDKDYSVTIGETFGAAQRGGSVHSSLRVSRRRSYGPLVPEGRAHAIIGLEPLETLRMLSAFGNPDVITVTNTNPTYPVGVLSKRVTYPALDDFRSAIRSLSKASWFIDAAAVARELKSPMVANIVMLGAITATNTLPVSVEEVEKEIKNTFPASVLELNLKAMEKGMNEVQPGRSAGKGPSIAPLHASTEGA